MSRYAVFDRAGGLIGLTWADSARAAVEQALRFGISCAATARRESW